jgi:hypothetical protein|tara:strand:- start:419 stop:595 length:177 start_codon:yes stop_codon:yes gene_type:complete
MNDPKKNLDEKFSEEFDSELEERINKDEPVLRDDDDEELREWREWALSYENDKGDVID